MKLHDESKLPKWAKKELDDLRTTQSDLSRSLKYMMKAHFVLNQMEWFALHPDLTDDKTTFFHLQSNHARPICTTYKGDMVLIGRQKVTTTPQRATGSVGE